MEVYPLNIRKTKLIKFIILGLFLCSISLSSFRNIPAQAQPPSTGDWEITGTEEITAQTILMNGSIVVKSGGRLTLSDVDIIFMLNENGMSNGEFNVTVTENSVLVLDNVNITTDDPTLRTYLLADESSTIQIDQSSFTNFGYAGQNAFILDHLVNDSYITNSMIDGPFSTVNYAIHVSFSEALQLHNLEILGGRGIYIGHSANTSVQNIHVRYSYNLGIYANNVTNLIVIGSEFLSENSTTTTTYGFYLYSDGINEKIRFVNNLISNNTDGVTRYGVFIRGKMRNEDDCTIQNNQITTNGHGIYLDINANGTYINDNTIQTQTSGITIDSVDGNGTKIINNTVFSNSYGLYASGAPNSPAQMLIEDNTFYLNNTGDHSTPFIRIGQSNINFRKNTLSSRLPYPIGIYSQGDNITIADITIQNATDVGIHAEDGNNIDITNNEIFSPSSYGLNTGINVTNVENSTIAGNNINSTLWNGLKLENTNHTQISSNSISEGIDVGILPENSHNLTIADNEISRIQRFGIYLSESGNSTIEHNVLDTMQYGVYSYYSSFNTFFDNSFVNSTYISIYFHHGDYNNFSNNDIDSFSATYGIYMNWLSYSNISSNLLNVRGATAVYDYQGDDNTIDYNEVSKNAYTGFYLAYTQDILTYNFIDTCFYGVYLWYTDNNQISYNTLISCSYGIYGYAADQNLLTYNAFVNNNIGAWLDNFCNDNTFHHNDFLGNSLQAYDKTAIGDNYWNETDTGNYWSDYSGPDVQPEFGIGDVPYNITGNTADFYPLVDPANEDAPPRVTSPADITYYQGEAGHIIRWIGFDVDPEMYVITRNDSVIESDTWDGYSPIEINVDGLTNGTWIYELYLNDTGNRNVSDSVFVTVLISTTPDNTPPLINSLGDKEIEAGSTTDTLVWTVSDEHPGLYQIFIDDVEVESDSWTSGSIQFVINTNTLGLELGSTYNVTIVVSDTYGNSVNDTVEVTVVEEISEESDLVESISDNPLVLLLGTGLGIIGTFAIIGLFKILTRGKVPKD